MTHVYNVTELTEYIKSVVGNKKIKVSGEISQPKLSGGHVYFTIKDESNNIKSIIWKSRNINKEDIVDGMKIVMDCKLDFYGGTGTVNLIVDKILTNDGFGDLFTKYEKIKKDFTEKGYFNRKKRKLPEQIKNILILTSEEGAALQDFIYNLDNNKSQLLYDIIDVKVQGIECPKNICEILKELQEDDTYYDMVVITRGGGSFSDLFGFSQPELIEIVNSFHLPVMSAIGHMIDNPLLDLVADYSAPTPSLAAQYIVDHNKKYITKLYNMKNNMKTVIMDILLRQQNILAKFNDKLYLQFNQLNNLKNRYNNIIKDMINNLTLKLSILETKISVDSTGGSIVLYDNNKKITDSNDLDNYINNKLTLKWNDKVYTIYLEK